MIRVIALHLNREVSISERLHFERTNRSEIGTSICLGLIEIVPRYSRDVLLVPKLLSHVHGERARPLPEAHALGAVAATVADLAEQLTLVLSAVGRVQQLVAHGCILKM